MSYSSNAVLIYGFNLGANEYIISFDYLKDRFPGINCYASGTVGNTLIEAIYGVPCGLNEKTGLIIISDEDKEKVRILYDKYVNHLKNNLPKKLFERRMEDIKLCYKTVVLGEYQVWQDPIILDKDWDETWDDDMVLWQAQIEIIESKLGICVWRHKEDVSDTSTDDIDMTNILKVPNIELSEEERILSDGERINIRARVESSSSSEEEDEIQQKTYRGVYYADAMNMEAAMRADAEKTRQLRHILEDEEEY